MRLLLCLLVISFAANAADEIYRWTDAAGRTHYSDFLPTTTQAERLDSAQLPHLHNQPQIKSIVSNGSSSSPKPSKVYRLSGTAPIASLKECKRRKRKAIAAERARRRPQTEELDNWLWKNCRSWSLELRKVEQDLM